MLSVLPSTDDDAENAVVTGRVAVVPVVSVVSVAVVSEVVDVLSDVGVPVVELAAAVVAEDEVGVERR